MATAGQQPLYRASVSQLGNKPAVEFDGTNDRLVVDITNIVGTYKMVMVLRLTATTASRVVMGTGQGPSQGFGASGSNTYQQNNGTALLTSTTRSTNGHVVRALCASGASGQIWIEGSSVASGAEGTTGIDWLKLGCGGATTTDTNFSPCQIAFCGIYTGATSDSDLATLAADLKTHYGL